MTCYHPSKVSVLRKALHRQGPRVSDVVTVPCGHCLGCRSSQARDWAFRLMHEAQVRESGWFATLTYAPENVPANGSLRPEDVQAFFKRLRKRVPERGLSYYVCGEYGETTYRPHYHAVLLGPAFLDRDLYTHRSGAPVYTSETLDDAWSYGLTELTGLSYEAALYVAGYVRKKVRAVEDPDQYLRVDPETGELVELEREFSRMSRRPALGLRWIEKYWSDVYPRDFVVMNGREYKPPRYYDKWMDAHEPEVMSNVRWQRIEDAEKIGDEKLIMKEKVHRARLGLFSQRSGV